MTVKVLTGSKDEIAQGLAHISGQIHEAIVFVEETNEVKRVAVEEDIFAEMEPFTVRTGGADYSRESLYTRMGDERYCWIQTCWAEFWIRAMRNMLPPLKRLPFCTSRESAWRSARKTSWNSTRLPHEKNGVWACLRRRHLPRSLRSRRDSGCCPTFRYTPNGRNWRRNTS